jgi:subtilase family serine protease
MATPDLAFRAVVENSGENQEVGVEVVLTIDQSPQPIEKRGKIQIINPGERKSITFRNLGQIVQFSQKTTLKVDVKPVPGETNISNNAASYSVTFTLVP